MSLYRRVEQYLQSGGGQQRLELCRRALYFKADLPLSVFRGVGWRSELLRRLVAGWGWDGRTLELLDQRRRWRIEKVREERDLLVAELGRSYRLLTSFAQRHAAEGGIDALELNLLGRKLYSALERRPGKIDRVALGRRREPRRDATAPHRVHAVPLLAPGAGAGEPGRVAGNAQDG